MTGQTPNPSVEPASEPGPCDCAASHDLSEDAVAADLHVLTAAGSETRYEALRLIAGAQGAVCVCELEPALGVSQGAVSQALSQLFSAGLVTRRKEGRWRYYDASPGAERLLDTLDDLRGLGDE